jgi:hypothetical protein
MMMWSVGRTSAVIVPNPAPQPVGKRVTCSALTKSPSSASSSSDGRVPPCSMPELALCTPKSRIARMPASRTRSSVESPR